MKKIDEILYFVYNEINLKTSEEEVMKQSGKKTALAAMGLCAVLMLTGCGKSDAAKYEEAQKLVREGAYDEAITAFTEIDGYEDSSKYLMYIKAIQLAEKGEWELAVNSLTTLGDFADSKMLAIYYQAQAYEAKESYEEADVLYRTIATFKDSTEHIAAIPDLILDRDFANSKWKLEWSGKWDDMLEMLSKTYSDDENKMKQKVYDVAQEQLNKKHFDAAHALFSALAREWYEDSTVRVKDTVFAYAEDQMEQGEYTVALDAMTKLENYPAAEEPIRECRYQLATQAEANGQYAKAYAEYIDLGEYKDCADRAAHFENEYAAATALLTEEEYDNAKSAFEALKDYADAEKMAKESVYQKGKKQLADGQFDEAEATFESLEDYADARTMAKESAYQKGKKQLADEQFDEAEATFESLEDYADAQTMVKESVYQKGKKQLADEQFDEAEAAFESLEDYADAQTMVKESVYQKGKKQLADGQYDLALSTFSTLGTYKKAYDNASYAQSRIDMQEGDYQKALDGLVKLMGYGYQEAEEPIRECRYQLATQAEENGQYAKAYAEYIELGEYKDCADRAVKFENDYATAQNLLDAGDYDQAEAGFEALKDYADASTMAQEAAYQKGKKQLADGAFDEAKATFESLKDYADAETMVKESVYQKGKKQFAEGLFAEAEATFDTLDEYSDTKEQILAIGEHYYATRQYEQAETIYVKVSAAQQLYELGQYYESQDNLPNAIRVYGEAGTYEDAGDKVTALQREEDYRTAESLYQEKEWQEAKAIYERLTDYKDTESKIAVCNAEIRDAAFQPWKIVQFGHYPQTKENNDDRLIEWQVLARDGRNALLISRYGLDKLPYNETLANVTWEQCTLRAWLNSTFINRTFTDEEQTAILVTDVDNGTGQGYEGWSVEGSNNTLDKIFLLSYAEAYQYFGVTYENGDNIKARVAPYDFVSWSAQKTEEGIGAIAWWLRSPGEAQIYALYVGADGHIGSEDVAGDGGFNAVRPALWVNIDSGIF